MRLKFILACGLVAGCTTGDITVPNDAVIYEVPRQAVSPAITTGDGDFVSTIESAIDGGAPVAQGDAAPTGPLDADVLNLTLFTIEQQKIDAANAERDLAAARSQLVVVQPGALPQRVDGVNIALFAQQARNEPGVRVYSRPVTAGLTARGCRRFTSSDEAQRAFLANGGPQRDPLNLDPDGDGFACDWDPTPYRALQL